MSPSRSLCRPDLNQLASTKPGPIQLLSHGLNGVQETHYDRYHYIKQKRDVLAVWERYLLKMAEERKSAYLQGTGRTGAFVEPPDSAQSVPDTERTR